MADAGRCSRTIPERLTAGHKTLRSSITAEKTTLQIAIGGVMKEVADGKMPIEDWGPPKSLDPAFKSLFLDRGTQFAEALDGARAWELAHPPR